MEPTILTVDGTYFNFIEVKNNKISIQTIARGLSNCCRFAGQVEEFYSVAQHSVLCSYHVQEEYALQALMHDAAESVLGDVTRPLKSLLKDYQFIERHVEKDMFFKLGIDYPFHPCVKEVDIRLLATERRDLFPNYVPDSKWSILQDVIPLEEKIIPLLPNCAYNLFLARFFQLTGRA